MLKNLFLVLVGVGVLTFFAPQLKAQQTLYVGNTSLYTYGTIPLVNIYPDLCSAVNAINADGGTIYVDHRVITRNRACVVDYDLTIQGWYAEDPTHTYPYPAKMVVDSGKSPFPITVSGSTMTAAGFAPEDGWALHFGGTPPSPLVAATNYYTVNSNKAANTFQVSGARGGVPITLSNGGTSPTVVATGISGNHGPLQVDTGGVFLDLEYIDISAPYVYGCTTCAATWVSAGSSLTARHSSFSGINGLLTAEGEFTGDFLFEYVEFWDSGYCTTNGSFGTTHNIYVGNAHSLTMRYSWSHGSCGGHLLKTRSQRTFLYYNRFSHEGDINNYIDGVASAGAHGPYSPATFQPVSLIPLNIPIGGEVVMVGNEVVSGPMEPAMSGSSAARLGFVQYDDECTKDSLSHGRHPYRSADITTNVGAADTTLHVTPGQIIDWPSSGTIQATIMTYGRLNKGGVGGVGNTTGTTANLDPTTITDFPDPATVGAYDVVSGDEAWTITALNFITGVATVVRGAESTIPVNTHYGGEMVRIITPEQISFLASNVNHSTGAITSVTRGINGAGWAGTHAIKMSVGIYLTGIPASSFYAVNNTFISDPKGKGTPGSAAKPAGTGWNNGGTPASYGPIQYGISTFQPVSQGNSDCFLDNKGTFYLANNLIYTPQVGLVGAGGTQSNAGNPWSLQYSRFFGDLIVDTTDATKVSSSSYTFVAGDVGRTVHIDATAPTTQFKVSNQSTGTLTTAVSGGFQFINGSPVTLTCTNCNLPGGYATSTTYYVVNLNLGASTLQLSTTRGGSPITSLSSVGDCGTKTCNLNSSWTKNANYTISSVSGGAAVLSAAPAGASGQYTSNGRWYLWGDLPTPTNTTNLVVAAESGSAYPANLQNLFLSPPVYVEDTSDPLNFVTLAHLSSGTFDLHLPSTASSAISSGTAAGSLPVIAAPCGGMNLPDTCTLSAVSEYSHPRGTISRANTTDIGAHLYNPSLTTNRITIPLGSVTPNSSGNASATISALGYDAHVSCQSSDERVVHRISPATYLHAGQTTPTCPYTTTAVGGPGTIYMNITNLGGGGSLPTPPSITSISPLANISAGAVYTFTFAESGGTAAFTWSNPTGTMPPGLALSSGGVLSGTPTTPGAYSFAVRVVDSNSLSDQKTFTISVIAAINNGTVLLNCTACSQK